MKYFVFIIFISFSLQFLLGCNSKSAEDLVFEGVRKTKEHNLEEALALFDQAIEIKPDYAEAFKHRGRTKFNMGDAEGALVDFTEAISIDTNYAEAYFNRAKILNYFGKEEMGCKDLKKAKELKYPNIDDDYRMCLKYEK